MIETPGPKGKKEAGIVKARIIGIVVFSGCVKYQSKSDWENDFEYHKVEKLNEQFVFTLENPKWEWKIERTFAFDEPIPAPQKRGIVFATTCRI